MLRRLIFATATMLVILGVSACGQSDAPVLAYDNGEQDPPIPADAGESVPTSEQSADTMGYGAFISYPPSQADLSRDTLSNYTWQFTRSGTDNWPGWSGSRTFASNGTYADSNGDAGTWLLRGNGQLLMSDGNGDMYLATLSGFSTSGQSYRDGAVSTFQMYR